MGDPAALSPGSGVDNPAALSPGLAVDNPVALLPGSATLPVRGPTPEAVRGLPPEVVRAVTPGVVRGPERARLLRRLTRPVPRARALPTAQAVPTAHALGKLRPVARVLALVVVLAATLSTHGGSVAAAAPGSAVSAVSAASAVTNLGGQPGVASVEQAPVAPPRVRAKAVIVADEATGQVLYERNAGSARAMASTTKVMTALLALERLDERTVVTIGPRPPKVGEESLRLRQGERLTIRQLLLGLMLKSANDAGVAIAEAVDGSEAAFVRRMNRKAAALRLSETHYVTPYGLDRPGHQTSARDLARLWEVAMRRADFRALVATKAARLPGAPLSIRRFVTTNQLLGSYRWTVGGKTGFTNRAGRCLVASASRGGRRLVAVALGSPDAFPDVQALFEYGFSKFVRVRLAQRGQPVSETFGDPATLRVDTDADAVVRLDQLDEVRLALPEGVTSATTSAWLTVGGRRLVRVRLARLPAGGAGPASTLLPPPTVSRVAPSTTGTGTAARAGGPLATTLSADATVTPWPVPPGAPEPTIDPFLRRDPP
jgi:D-alanyl-D-alanine carboxypeptidase